MILFLITTGIESCAAGSNSESVGSAADATKQTKNETNIYIMRRRTTFYHVKIHAKLRIISEK